MSDSLLYVPVRFRTGSKTYTFSISGFMAHPHDSVVVETKRGLEIGQVTGEANSSSGLAEGFEIKPVIRLATQEDLAKEKESLQQDKTTIIRNLLNAGFKEEEIAKMINMSLEDIKKIKNR